ncbi:MAG TPA: hypothetical protein VGN23_05965 [Verrucomicrobiae bacterium]
MAVLIPVVYHYQLRFTAAHYISELKAKGEPMDLAQVTPPQVPLEQNAAPLIMSALTNLEGKYNSISETNPPPMMLAVSPGKAMVEWNQPVIADFDWDSWPESNNVVTNTWEDLGKELDAAKGDLQAFQCLTNHPLLDFNLDYGKAYSIQLRHLSRLGHAARWLSASAIFHLHERQTAEACEDTHLILAIVRGWTDERLKDSQSTRDAIASIAAETTWEILQDPAVSESDLASLQQDWESIEFIDPARKAFLTERVVNVLSTEHYLQDPSDLWRGVSGDRDTVLYQLCKLQWQWFWAYADEKRMVQIYQILADAMRMAETNGSYGSAQSFVRTNADQLGFDWPFPQEETFRMDIDPLDVHCLMSEDAFDSFSLLRRAFIFENARNMVIAAIALKRYELQHHEFPPTLDELIPAFLQTIPRDYMNGQALQYKRNSDGTFLLYSVGENGIDDGGKPSTHEWWEFYWFAHDFDLVWPQPATSEEIQNFYEHPPKEGGS